MVLVYCQLNRLSSQSYCPIYRKRKSNSLSIGIKTCCLVHSSHHRVFDVVLNNVLKQVSFYYTFVDCSVQLYRYRHVHSSYRGNLDQVCITGSTIDHATCYNHVITGLKIHYLRSSFLGIIEENIRGIKFLTKHRCYAP